MSNLRPVSDRKMARGAVEFFRQFEAHDGESGWPSWLPPWSEVKRRLKAGCDADHKTRAKKFADRFGIFGEEF